MDQSEIAWPGNFLNSLSPRTREQLLSLADTFRFLRGDVIFRQNDPSLFLFLVKSGSVAIEIHVPMRGSRCLVTLGTGEPFSWSALIPPQIETATARATEDTLVLAIPGKKLMELCDSDCPFGQEIYRALAGVISMRLRATHMQVMDVYAVR